MKILFLSDLHLDINSKETETDLVPLVIAFINSKSPSIVVISGDISGDAQTTINILELLQKNTQSKIVFVPGNHDIWTDKESSWDGYETLINHSTSIVNKPLLLENDWAILGYMGWYDYSFGIETIPLPKYQRLKKKLWNDALYARWQMSDDDLNKKLLSELEEQLNDLKDKKVILSTHFIPYKPFITFTGDNNWNICNGFMGSSSTGKLLNQHKNVEYVSFGHTHKRFGLVNHNQKNIICNPLGYTFEWTDDSFSKQLEESSVLINI